MLIKPVEQCTSSTASERAIANAFNAGAILGQNGAAIGVQTHGSQQLFTMWVGPVGHRFAQSQSMV